MSDHDWRAWVWDKVSNSNELRTLIPVERMHGAGSVVGDPSAKPFLTFVLGSKIDELRDAGRSIAHSQLLTVWIYDEPGSYEIIDQCLGIVRDLLCVDIAEPGAITAEWTGDSGDFPADDYNGITRNSTYRLVGGS